MSSGGPVLHLVEGAEALVTDSGSVVLRGGGQSVEARGLHPALLRAVVGAVDGTRTGGDVVAHLEHEYPRGHVEAVLRGLTGTLLVEMPPGGPVREGLVGVLGTGPLADGIHQVLEGEGYRDGRLWGRGVFASCEDPTFLAAQAERMPLANHAPSAPSGEPLSDTGLDELLSTVDLVVCALEWVPYRAHLDVADSALRTGTPVLFVSGDPDGGTVGPLYVPSASACFECERLSAVFDGATALGSPRDLLPFLHCRGVARGSDMAARITSEAVRVVTSTLPAPVSDGSFASVTRVPSSGPPVRHVVLPRIDCSRCAPALVNGLPTTADAVPPPERFLVAALADVAVEQDRASAERPATTRDRSRPEYATVGILGGGTAGYLTALTFRRRFPDIDVTLIESSKVGVIGVGEATTPRLTEYLHSPADLGLDIVDFHERVAPVWKLGVLYQWGRPGNEFPWPFQYGALLDSYLHDGNLSAHCLAAILMEAKRVPVLRGEGGRCTSVLGRIPFAYHLDNPRFVRYLQEEADRSGVIRRDVVVTDATVAADGETVEALITENGDALSFDLYVDCSGFRSVLLEGKLRSPFVSYADSLFTDSAVVANVPHDGVTKPYTVAETMANGWCWNIAFEEEDHRGYVFSSAFCSADEAEAEMRAANPGMSDAWSLRFRSGRHEHFWKGNVVAVGNAYAFVEPLASTAIHMLLFELDLLGNNLPAVSEDGHKAVLNAKANEMWDSLRGWLAVQYRFNTRMDTPFWRACQSDVNLADALPYVERFRERGLLSGEAAPPSQTGPVKSRYANDYFSQDYVYDVMLLGQDVPGRLGAPRTRLEEWRARTARSRSLVDHALSQGEAFGWARQHPEQLVDLVHSPDSWLGEQLY